MLELRRRLLEQELLILFSISMGMWEMEGSWLVVIRDRESGNNDDNTE